MDKKKVEADADEGTEAKNSEGLERVSDSCLVRVRAHVIHCHSGSYHVIPCHIMIYHVISMFECLEILIPTEEGS